MDTHRSDPSRHWQKIEARLLGAIELVESGAGVDDPALPTELDRAMRAAGLDPSRSSSREVIEARFASLEHRRVEVVASAAGPLAALERLLAE